MAAAAAVVGSQSALALVPPQPLTDSRLLEYSGALVAAGGWLTVEADGATKLVSPSGAGALTKLRPRQLHRLRAALGRCGCDGKATRSADGTERRLRFRAGSRERVWMLWPVDQWHPDAGHAPPPSHAQHELLRELDAAIRRAAARGFELVYRRHNVVASVRLEVRRDGGYVLSQGHGTIEGRLSSAARARLRSWVNDGRLARGAPRRRSGQLGASRDLNAYRMSATLQVVPRSDDSSAEPATRAEARLLRRLDMLVQKLLRDHADRTHREAVRTPLRVRPGVDVLPGAALRIVGAHPGDRAGTSVAAASDIDGDGISDYVVGAPSADTPGGLRAGRAYVVFGSREATHVDLARLGRRGFEIGGSRAGDRLGASVAAVGDLDRDGRDDLLVGAPGSSARGRTGAGAAFVIYGKSDSRPVDVRRLRGGGVRLDGAFAGEALGSSVSAAGDVNGDGLRDVVVGTGGYGREHHFPSTTAYVVTAVGRQRAASDLRDARSVGFRIGLDRPELRGGRFFLAAEPAAAGDVNGDGLDDIALGGGIVWYSQIPRNGSLVSSYTSSFENERAYVVFGRRSPTDVNVAKLEDSGFEVRIENPSEAWSFGSAVAGVGDVNRDGRGDVAIGASGYHARGTQRGSVFTVFGAARTATLDPRSAGAGFRLDGPRNYGFAGSSLAGAGDVDGDGTPDLLVGAPGSGGACDDGPGRAYAWLTDGTSPRARGYEIAGLPLHSGLGTAVAARPGGPRAGALILGAPGVSPSRRRMEAGAAYVVRVRDLTRRPARALAERTTRCR